MVAHHHHRRLVEALDQQPRLVPDRKGDGAERADHALRRAANPRRWRSARRRLRRRALRTCPIGRCRAHMVLHQIVDLGADPADRLAAALCQPQLPPGHARTRDFAWDRAARGPRPSAAGPSRDRPCKPPRRSRRRPCGRPWYSTGRMVTGSVMRDCVAGPVAATQPLIAQTGTATMVPLSPANGTDKL